MPDRIYPAAGVGFNTPLGYDDSDFRALKVDAHGRQQVRGENQLFSFKGVLAQMVTGLIDGAGGSINTLTVPVGEIWALTNIASSDRTSATTNQVVRVIHDGISIWVTETRRAIVAGELVPWRGHLYLDAADYVRVCFAGGLAGDTVEINLMGYRMTVEG